MRFLGTRFNALDDCYTVIPASLPARTESNLLDSCPTHCAMPTSLNVAPQTRRNWSVCSKSRKNDGYSDEQIASSSGFQSISPSFLGE